MTVLATDQPERILAERARRLARVEESREERGDGTEVLVFRLSAERYAIETEYVREIVQFADCTLVPSTPSVLLGVTNLRGEILPIFEMREMLSLPLRAVSELFRVIVVGAEGPEFGILSDEVIEVRVIPVDAALESESGFARDRVVRGVTPEALVVLDGKGLLTDARLFVGRA